MLIHFCKKEALCLRLVCPKPEKLQKVSKRRYDGLHAYSVGLLFPHLLTKVFSGPGH